MVQLHEVYSLDGNQHRQKTVMRVVCDSLPDALFTFASEAAQMPENQFRDEVTAPELEVFNANDEKAISLWRNNDKGSHRQRIITETDLESTVDDTAQSGV